MECDQIRLIFQHIPTPSWSTFFCHCCSALIQMEKSSTADMTSSYELFQQWTFQPTIYIYIYIYILDISMSISVDVYKTETISYILSIFINFWWKKTIHDHLVGGAYKGVRAPPKKGVQSVIVKLYQMVRIQIWRSGECDVLHLLPLLLGPLWPGIVLYVRILSGGQRDLFANCLYLIGILDVI